jgi:uncharacterized protein (TIGR04255 family)
MPVIRPLPNKPLVEAIFEFIWQIPRREGDPHYPLFVGRLYDRVQSKYPFHESLPTSFIPLPAAENIIQHRFRKEDGCWPLIQVGPGIVTINDTEGYIWQDFGQRAKALIKAIYESYPEPQELKVARLNLRYLDAFYLEPDQNIFDYLAEKLKSKVSLPYQLFEGTAIASHPKMVNVMASFATENPKGNILIRFGSGKHSDKPALIMETAVQSSSDDLPKMPDRFEEWVEASHKLTDDWFFKFIEGELYRRFAGE